ncbi:LLM class flavin-dependent oxidoreductase [Kribbella sandramycini]|uniref:Alkanesulfonate monooxygenase SsuD/methylene tetrahydromethanopterin reductase-like flavin-dependent oxidoreductase (Luciferase family) n=1 Tax=Kribbella sandramycini TaxID=60450 RepID=A0A7Y4L0J6_9ACTN|nr:LLM class flavin-dependent oxidoreductase [Kribbella sandramycini]MBB6569055.1 alkanesulfonate monooxygenase SsuD/methylene tetrahydromethanopterin reductase-like flavin-dependent oxidoreductase (luciferase family) [Kribbella sandramycini]NOL41101.1 LLM class flavin-dependent oxidoreductase [Kribbella sandramycini]
MTDVLFGVSIAPATEVEQVRAAALAAEHAGLDLVGIQDEPYFGHRLEAFTLMADLLARTERIHLFPDVVALPLRPAPVLARTASTLSLMSGGRFQLGLGAGGVWDAMTSMGAEQLQPAQSLAALAESITLLRQLWQTEVEVAAAGEWYPVHSLASQAPHSAGIEIWLGALRARSLALTGRVADGWAAPTQKYLPMEVWADGNRAVDRAAAEAGRDPAAIRRLAQVIGTITPDATSGPIELTGKAPIRTSAAGWSDLLTKLAEEHGFTGFVFWPEHEAASQSTVFGAEVVPLVRQRLG